MEAANRKMTYNSVHLIIAATVWPLAHLHKHGVGDLDFDEPIWNTSWRQVEFFLKPQRVMDLRWKKCGRIMHIELPY